MANKMISQKDLNDEVITSMIRSDEPLQVPEGFMDDVMGRIGLIGSKTAIKPYSPPFWLKWGIPGFVISVLVTFLFLGKKGQTNSLDTGATIVAGAFKTINSWFSGFNIDIHLPEVDLSGTIIWILVGVMILTWSFLLLSRFLERRLRH